SPPAMLRGQAAEWLPAFRVAVRSLPESAIVGTALSQSGVLGLPQEQGNRLLPLVTNEYLQMAQSPTYAKADSALPYCYGEAKPTTGFAQVYVPKGAKAATPAMVFLHGTGGSFLWYQHVLSKHFPDHLIICPAYGIGTHLLPATYFLECRSAVSKKLGIPITNPDLIGLSAGGFGACRLFAEIPDEFSQLICLAAFPDDAAIAKLRRGDRLRFLAGAEEPFVTSGDLQRRLERLRSKGAMVDERTVPLADHFFLLSHQKETAEILGNWLATESTHRRTQ
ncbi:MAG: alpha/beta hydrolase, partial [Verrucomicrobiae bacterium]|nr:alpha/beta hydrolase [Verrucomicrobiae bacterium]